jgi:hypothetical protein
MGQINFQSSKQPYVGSLEQRTIEEQQTSAQDFEREQLRLALGKTIAETVQAIAKDRFNRRQNYTTQLELLNGGIWYRGDYYRALESLAPNVQAAQCIEFLKRNHCFYHAFAANDLFQYVPKSDAPLGYDPSTLQIKPGVEPSRALHALLHEKKFAMMTCLMIVQLGQYQALLQTLGREKFNKLFGHSSVYPLTLGEKDDPLKYFRITSTGAPAVGQLTGAYNVDDYAVKHFYSLGLAGDFSIVTLDVSNPKQIKYVGFGFSPEGVTKEEIETHLVKSYNVVPLDASPFSDELVEKLIKGGRPFATAYANLMKDPNVANQKALKSILLKDHKMHHVKAQATIDKWVKVAKPLTLEEAKKDPDFGIIPQSLELNVALIQQLIKMPIEEVSWNFIRQFHEASELTEGESENHGVADVEMQDANPNQRDEDQRF